MSAPKTDMLRSFELQKQTTSAKPLSIEELRKLIADKNAVMDVIRKEQTDKSPQLTLEVNNKMLKENKEKLEACRKDMAKLKPLIDLFTPYEKASSANMKIIQKNIHSDEFMESPEEIKIHNELEKERKKLMESGKFKECMIAHSQLSGLKYMEAVHLDSIAGCEKRIQAATKDLQLEQRIEDISKEISPLSLQLRELLKAEREKKESKAAKP